LALPVLKETKVHKVLKGLVVVLRVTKDHRVIKVLSARRVIRVPVVLRDIP
jgi:hypothetical protein